MAVDKKNWRRHGGFSLWSKVNRRVWHSVTEVLVQTKNLIIGIILSVTSWTSHLIFSTVGEKTQASTTFSLTRANRSKAIFSPFCFYLRYSLLVACRLLTHYLIKSLPRCWETLVISDFEFREKKMILSQLNESQKWGIREVCACLCVCMLRGGVDPITLGCPGARHLINSCSSAAAAAAESCGCDSQMDVRLCRSEWVKRSNSSAEKIKDKLNLHVQRLSPNKFCIHQNLKLG